MEEYYNELKEVFDLRNSDKFAVEEIENKMNENLNRGFEINNQVFAMDKESIEYGVLMKEKEGLEKENEELKTKKEEIENKFFKRMASIKNRLESNIKEKEKELEKNENEKLNDANIKLETAKKHLEELQKVTLKSNSIDREIEVTKKGIENIQKHIDKINKNSIAILKELSEMRKLNEYISYNKYNQLEDLVNGKTVTTTQQNQEQKNETKQEKAEEAKETGDKPIVEENGSKPEVVMNSEQNFETTETPSKVLAQEEKQEKAEETKVEEETGNKAIVKGKTIKIPDHLKNRTKISVDKFQTEGQKTEGQKTEGQETEEQESSISSIIEKIGKIKIGKKGLFIDDDKIFKFRKVRKTYKMKEEKKKEIINEVFGLDMIISEKVIKNADPNVLRVVKEQMNNGVITEEEAQTYLSKYMSAIEGNKKSQEELKESIIYNKKGTEYLKIPHIINQIFNRKVYEKFTEYANSHMGFAKIIPDEPGLLLRTLPISSKMDNLLEQKEKIKLLGNGKKANDYIKNLEIDEYLKAKLSEIEERASKAKKNESQEQDSQQENSEQVER